MCLCNGVVQLHFILLMSLSVPEGLLSRLLVLQFVWVSEKALTHWQIRLQTQSHFAVTNCWGCVGTWVFKLWFNVCDADAGQSSRIYCNKTRTHGSTSPNSTGILICCSTAGQSSATCQLWSITVYTTANATKKCVTMFQMWMMCVARQLKLFSCNKYTWHKVQTDALKSKNHNRKKSVGLWQSEKVTSQWRMTGTHLAQENSNSRQKTLAKTVPQETEKYKTIGVDMYIICAYRDRTIPWFSCL